jgi:hypothetical protein
MSVEKAPMSADKRPLGILGGVKTIFLENLQTNWQTGSRHSKE